MACFQCSLLASAAFRRKLNQQLSLHLPKSEGDLPRVLEHQVLVHAAWFLPSNQSRPQAVPGYQTNTNAL